MPSVENYSKHEKQRELKKNNCAAGEQCDLAFPFRFRGEQSLDDGLISAVAGHGEKSTTDYARPKCIGFGGIYQAEGEIEYGKFIRGSGCLHSGVPSAGDPVEQ